MQVIKGVNVKINDQFITPVSIHEYIIKLSQPSNCCLESEQKKESHHQTEQSHGLGQGKPKNSVGEKLLLKAWVPGISDDEGSED